MRSESGAIIGEIARGIGVATNNVAEYNALIEGLQMALDAESVTSTCTSTHPYWPDTF